MVDATHSDEAAGLASVQSIPQPGSGLVRLDLLRVNSDEDGRQRFERLVTAVVMKIHPTARAIRAEPGDWGIDTFVGQLSGGTTSVWQSKYFVDGIGDSQKKQIRESFKSVLDAAEKHGFQISSWTLALPLDMSPSATKWWDGWKSRTERKTGITIVLWSGSHIENLLIKEDLAEVRQQYFGLAPGEGLREREIEDPDDWSSYDSALFIAQLHAASVSDGRVARRAFFNAEVMTRDISEREARSEVGALGTIRSNLHQLWHTRFENAKSAHDPKDQQLPSLYPKVMRAVEDYHRTQPSTKLRDSLVHRSGLVHHLVEAGHAGWVRNYEDIRDAHGAGGNDV